MKTFKGKLLSLSAILLASTTIMTLPTQVQANSKKGDKQELKISTKSKKKNSKSTKVEKITDTIQYSAESVDAINKDFGQWLFESQYGKDSMVITGSPDDPAFTSHFRGGDIELWSYKTFDGDMFGRITGLYDNLDVTTGQSQYPNNYMDGSLEAFAKKLLGLKLGRLGVKIGSNQTADYAAKSSFRVYTLADKTHSLLTFEEEVQQIIDTKVPQSENFKAVHYGYVYLYEKLLEANKPSYQIILGNNGRVYQVDDYKDGSKSIYQKSPQDMQDKYQELLKKYKGNATSAKTETKTSFSKNWAVIPPELEGSWELDSASQGKQVITYEKDGKATRVDDQGGKYQATINPVEEVSPGLYHFVYLKGEQFTASFPVYGMGGIGFEADYGFKINGNQLIYVMWTRPMDTSFNPSSDRYQELDPLTKK